jgi:hypothetical protein
MSEEKEERRWGMRWEGVGRRDEDRIGWGRGEGGMRLECTGEGRRISA